MKYHAKVNALLSCPFLWKAHSLTFMINMKNLHWAWHLFISLLKSLWGMKTSIVFMHSLFSLTLVIMNVTWILNDFHIEGEKNDYCHRSRNRYPSWSRCFFGSTPLPKPSYESQIYWSVTILIERRKKNHAMKIPFLELVLLLMELNLQVQYF